MKAVSTEPERRSSLLQKAGWEQSLVRWRAFWEGKVADRPPVLIYQMASFSSDISPETTTETSSPNTVLARQLAYYDPAQNADLLEQAEQGLAMRAQWPDDMPPALVAGGGVHFTGAVFGAPVRATSNMLTAEPIIDDWYQANAIRYDPDNIWVRRALGLAQQLVARSAGHYAVIPGLIEGPSDICAALRGITRLARDLYEHPTEVTRLASKGAEAWQALARDLFAIIPLYDGGTVTQWNLWAPGRAAALQEDFCTVISPRQYRQFFLPLDRKLARSVDLLWVHVHAGAIHLVDELLTIEEIRGIQIVNDGVASPPIQRVLSAMQRIQERGKCLIVRKYSPQELELILPRLSPRGLAIDTYCPKLAEAQRWLEHVAQWPFGRAR